MANYLKIEISKNKVSRYIYYKDSLELSTIFYTFTLEALLREKSKDYTVKVKNIAKFFYLESIENGECPVKSLTELLKEVIKTTLHKEEITYEETIKNLLTIPYIEGFKVYKTDGEFKIFPTEDLENSKYINNPYNIDEIERDFLLKTNSFISDLSLPISGCERTAYIDLDSCGNKCWQLGLRVTLKNHKRVALD